tara:strand:- start:181 stop:1311 length:1131 start_codon:yes stop_codon:yes gene_type:complete
LINRDNEYPHLRKRFFSQDIKSVVKDKSFFSSLFNDLKEEFKRDFKVNTVDLVTGGPPCQGFSGIGIRRSYSVEKKQLPSNHLYQDMAFFVHKVQPKIFLFENVEGLLRSRWTKDGIKGEIFRDVLGTFQNLKGYSVKFKLIHAKDYGVPQNRPRILIIGIKNKLLKKRTSSLDALEAGFLPKTTNDFPDIVEVLSDLVDDSYKNGGSSDFYFNEPKTDWQKNIRSNEFTGQILKKGDSLKEHKYSNHSETVIQRFDYMLKNDGLIPKTHKTKKFAQRVLPSKWDKKGPNITACSLADDYVHFSQPRSLTVREWARLQTFPDWYLFAGKRTTGGIRRAGNPRESIFDRELPKYTQIGNAVPVKLAYEIGKNFLNFL